MVSPDSIVDAAKAICADGRTHNIFYNKDNDAIEVWPEDDFATDGLVFVTKATGDIPADKLASHIWAALQNSGIR